MYELWTEEISWFGTAVHPDGTPRFGVLTTDCVLRDRALRDLKNARHPHDLVLEAATVASLRDGVEAGFCQALLPANIAEAFQRASKISFGSSLQLTFTLIAGPSFDPGKTEQVARKFRKTIRASLSTK